MSDKKDKGYDATMMRFVGNLLSNEAFRNTYGGTDGYTLINAETSAIRSALRVRDKLRKIALDEEAKSAV